MDQIHDKPELYRQLEKLGEEWLAIEECLNQLRITSGVIIKLDGDDGWLGLKKYGSNIQNQYRICHNHNLGDGSFHPESWRSIQEWPAELRIKLAKKEYLDRLMLELNAKKDNITANACLAWQALVQWRETFHGKES